MSPHEYRELLAQTVAQEFAEIIGMLTSTLVMHKIESLKQLNGNTEAFNELVERQRPRYESIAQHAREYATGLAYAFVKGHMDAIEVSQALIMSKGLPNHTLECAQEIFHTSHQVDPDKYMIDKRQADGHVPYTLLNKVENRLKPFNKGEDN